MTKNELVFDWKKSEGLGRDKVASVLIVVVFFTIFFGLVDLRVPPFRSEPVEEAGLIRFTDPDMARSWLLEAEEKGPFPGRLEVDDALSLPAFSGGGLSSWNDYRVRLKPLGEEEALGRVDIAAKGIRVFPEIPSAAAGIPENVPERGTMRRKLILTTFDADALKWMPGTELPEFEVPAGVEAVPDALRFSVSIRGNGTVAELIPLTGGADPLQDAVVRWLRSVRFGEGADERWIGLRVDFVNGRENGAEPE
jgi:hypothetical protein